MAGERNSYRYGSVKQARQVKAEAELFASQRRQATAQAQQESALRVLRRQAAKSSLEREKALQQELDAERNIPIEVEEEPIMAEPITVKKIPVARAEELPVAEAQRIPVAEARRIPVAEAQRLRPLRVRGVVSQERAKEMAQRSYEEGVVDGAEDTERREGVGAFMRRVDATEQSELAKIEARTKVYQGLGSGAKYAMPVVVGAAAVGLSARFIFRQLSVVSTKFNELSKEEQMLIVMIIALGVGAVVAFFAWRMIR